MVRFVKCVWVLAMSVGLFITGLLISDWHYYIAMLQRFAEILQDIDICPIIGIFTVI